MSKKKPPSDPNAEAVRALKLQERAKAKLKLANELDRLSPKEKATELNLLQPLILGIASASSATQHLLTEVAVQPGSAKTTNILHILPWVEKKAATIGEKHHRTLHAFLVEVKTLVDSVLAVIKANKLHFATHPALLEHCKQMYNVALLETGTLLIVNHLLKEIYKEDPAAGKPSDPTRDPPSGPFVA